MSATKITRNTNANRMTAGIDSRNLDPSINKFIFPSIPHLPPKANASKAKAKGTGQGGAKRVRNRAVSADLRITKSSIRRLARRGGVKRISGLVYAETRMVLKEFVAKVLKDAILYTESAKRITVTAMDIVMALKRHGSTLYGFS
jgi:histone H4